MTDKRKSQTAGIAGGVINGLFGGGGGMVLLPLLSKWRKLEARSSFATCVAIMTGVAGGLIGGLTFEKVPVRFLKVIFGLFLLYGGVRYLLW